ncbi:MAG: cyclic 2,3-diphosphoglycerate synthase [Candidatus Cloacimonetes bacterium]|jgi:predicted GTPase|nr:cyclic 2,3-diphosphoglycerate synthase [Candidatus Cloacimonadota bacterium]MCB5286986.1 cyclic 2,3-diphosphoglycerate synthase [Candidatus Cloacimonadota bacterium]MCK9185339.1 cyclic 2,3-diphosphoglycerate synthase [Candidatus Cloacimonadota bacterium]MCK9583651.1 cyclic 2,3-diphosphoglycerate synthase [Candidatus Cloacimonadota bacterium]MDY0229306.1 cyclic 2,3-diphosphoglycerate synthase [Candidatus Cloacimonadaceae bacterium]
MKRNVLIMGAAGRDFHNFNVFFRDNKDYDVVAFTATQIPGIDDKKYPAALAGKLYPNGIEIKPESELKALIEKHNVDLVVLAYSDLLYEDVMHKASLVNAIGADFMLMGANNTTIKTTKPLVTVCATRTGCGKSQTTRTVVKALKERGLKVVSIRHPMPYGDLVKQKVQRFAEIADLKKHKCTIEEMEEYEPHIMMGSVIYSGVDYEAIVREAEKEADVIIWDGGNNDIPFYCSDEMVRIVVVDPHRPGDEIGYYPGETNVLMADVVVINKIDSADLDDINEVRENVREINPTAIIIDAASPLFVDHPEMILGKNVLVVEDGPTLTHGNMPFGAGTVAAVKYGCADFVDPRPWAVGEMKETFEKYPDIGTLLPAMGYSAQQIKDLEKTINAVECDSVVIATPIDLRRIVKITKPACQVEYELQEIGVPTIKDVLANFAIAKKAAPKKAAPKKAAPKATKKATPKKK